MATQVTLNSGSVDSAGSLALKTNGTTTAVTIDTSQNVGIGTSSPSYRLDVRATTAVAQVKSDTGTNAAYYISNNTGGDFYIGREGSAGTTFGTTAYSSVLWSAGAYPMSFFTNGTERARIDSSGNLLVGATSQYSDEKFNVTQSSAKSGITVRLSGGPYNNTSYAMIEGRDGTTVRFYFPSNGGLYNYSANNFNLASDLRLKKDIQSVQSYWNVFKSIEWKTWLYNDQTDEIKNIGVIAQELQALAPELVCESNALPTPEGESPYLGLWENDFKMAGMSVITELVKRCEEQQAIITQLQADVAALKGASA